MRILRIIASMQSSNGGPCQGIRNASAELEKLGVDCEVVSLDAPSTILPENDRFILHTLGPGKGPWCYSPKLMPWLLENMGRFDAVIVHGLWLYPSHAAAKAWKMFKQKQQQAHGQAAKKVPQFFVMPHGMLDPYFQQARGRRLKALRNMVYWKLFESKVVNEATGLLFTCQQELQLAREPFRPYQPKREINVGYGIEAPPVYNSLMQEAFLKECPRLKDRPYLLFLSRIHPKKAVDLLIDAYAKLLNDKSVGDLPALLIAGPGLQSSYGRKLQKGVADTPELPGHVFFCDMLSGEAKWGAFYVCKAFVLPSHQENFGIAIVEAMACGKAVLISNQVNICREIEQSGSGIVADDSPEGVLTMLKQWINLRKDARELMGQQARRCFEKNFAIESAGVRLREVLSS